MILQSSAAVATKIFQERYEYEMKRPESMRAVAAMAGTALLLSMGIGSSFLGGVATAAAGSHKKGVLQPPVIYGGFQHSRIYLPQGDVAFADEAYDFKLGKKKSEVLWRKPEAALGPPDFSDYEADRLAQKPHFLCLGSTGSVILHFSDNALVDGPGPDLYIFEPSISRTSSIVLEISRDGVNWTRLPDQVQTAREVDISKAAKPGEPYHFVRITDASAIDEADQWPGANIDAVAALNSALKISIDDKALFDDDNKFVAGAANELNKVKDLWENVNGNKVIIEAYGEQIGKMHTSEKVLQEQVDQVKDWLTKEAKIPADRISTQIFEDARSLAVRDVPKEHGKDSRVDCTVILNNRDTVGSGITTRPVEYIDGKWNSNLGPVIIAARFNPKTKQTSIAGEWVEVPTKGAVIQDGTYNPKTGDLSFTFRQYNQTHGTGTFHLGADPNRVRGQWKSEDGKTSEWILERPLY